MQSALNFLREKMANGKGAIKLDENESKVFKDFAYDYRPFLYGAAALGANSYITRGLKQTQMRWIRIPLNIFAFGTGLSLGWNSALQTFLVNFYSLPNSRLAAEGREYLKVREP